MPSIQRVHDAYRANMNTRNGHSDSAFRRAEAIERTDKRDVAGKNSKSLFKDILQQKMESSSRK